MFLQAKEAQASVLEDYAGDQPVHQPRASGSCRPTPDAGRERHLPRLAAHHRP